MSKLSSWFRSDTGKATLGVVGGIAENFLGGGQKEVAVVPPQPPPPPATNYTYIAIAAAVGLVAVALILRRK